MIKAGKAWGTFESTICSFCNELPTTHYCTAQVPGSNICTHDLLDVDICGKAFCTLSRQSWEGDITDYIGRCEHHAKEDKKKYEMKEKKDKKKLREKIRRI